MIIIEMDSDSQAFHALNCAILRCGFKLRIALDEGQFKIKTDEGTWTSDLEGATVKANGNSPDLLRDLGERRAAANLQALIDAVDYSKVKGPNHA